MRGYKLSNEFDRTFGECLWGEGVTHTAAGVGGFCTSGQIHFYTDPLLAVLLSPIHVNFAIPHLWVVEADDPILDDHGLKYGTKRLTTLHRCELPEVTLTQRVAFGILCAREVFENPDWRIWAEGWLKGTNHGGASARAASAAQATRVEEAAWAAWAAARAASAAQAAAWTETEASLRAVWTASAQAAAHAARSAAAEAAARAWGTSPRSAAAEAARAAEAAAAGKELPLSELAARAIRDY